MMKYIGRVCDRIWKMTENHPLVWFIVGLIPLAWMVWVNVFPAGYIVSGGDVLQLLRVQDNFWFLHYEWAGRVSLFYALFYVLDSLVVSETGQLSWYLGIFLFGSYVSFYVFSRLVFPHALRSVSMLVSILYAANVYTLYIFTSTWGYTHYQMLYIFIPALTGLYMRVLSSRKMLWVYTFLLVVFLASGGSFGNPAFALSLALYFAFLTIALLALRKEWFTVATAKVLGAIAFGAVLLNVYWIWPMVPQVRSGIAGVSSSTDIVLADALQKTSNAISDTVRLVQTGEKDVYYPYNFPYKSLGRFQSAISLMLYVPFFLALVGVCVACKKSGRKEFILFFTLFVLFVFLVARVRFPFETINNFLFQLPGLNTLRGYDKTAIYTPFLLMALVLATLVFLQRKRLFLIVPVVLLVVYGVSSALPFYIGGIQTKMSYIFANDSKKSYQSSKYSALIKTPKEYFDIVGMIDTDQSDVKVTRLPFSEGSSIGRANFPRLKLNGPAPERYMLRAGSFIDPNEVYFPHWRFGSDLENISHDPRWMTDIYGLLGVKYIIYHKDAKPGSLEKTERMMKFLADRGNVELVAENGWLALYRIDSRYVLPYAYMSDAPDPSMQESAVGILAKASVLREHIRRVPYAKHPDKRVELTVSSDGRNGSSNRTVLLNERYDALWQAEFVNASGGVRPLYRDNRVLYANGWKLGSQDQDGKVVIRYVPIERFYQGVWVSGATLAVVIAGFVVSCVKRRKPL